MFHTTKNLVFKDVDLPTTLETFLERRIISLKGSALLNNYEALNEENEVHSSLLMSNVSQFNAICDNENNIPLLPCSRNENKITRINCQELESSNQINAIRISSKVKYPLCSSGRIQVTSGMYKCNTCGLPVHAIEGSSYNYVNEDTVELCSDCFNGSINTNNSNSYSSNTLSQIFETPTEGHIDNGEQSILNLYTEQKINNSNKSQNQINKISLIKNNDDISNENIAMEKPNLTGIGKKKINKILFIAKSSSKIYRYDSQTNKIPTIAKKWFKSRRSEGIIFEKIWLSYTFKYMCLRYSRFSP
ncbi:unnamed protein product [Macrosiphum euphorbiae]|uniref:ZZ-type domain-containing protein n=1 Tax=Macrosiphum euphorbiae TaxID=13131 RepID=A0AAV0XUC9_9HEMI|nr:unnamed protein product [Macrosiphum euphorbiae]